MSGFGIAPGHMPVNPLLPHACSRILRLPSGVEMTHGEMGEERVKVMCVRGIRRWGPAAVALTLLAGFFQGIQASPAVAAGCWRATCSDKDPIQMGCDADAEILQQVTEADGSVAVRLMWSPDCQAVWAKVSRDLDTSPDYVYLTLWTTRDPDGGIEAYDTAGLLGTGVAGAYTPMRNWKSTTAKACWNDVNAQYDPEPMKYVIQDPTASGDKPVDVSLPALHGSCTDWM
ncbi:DUF2690 domain-containing protein [Streptomyces tanashiensis]|jgi:hypothetical protein|uniref:YjfA family protein n=1 Tax=Streptomyces tanashiensis TaxID=67367 RepID=A0ABY6QTD9_9ACTN|nr:DUF2690 domain-containing protein [Streptomyces tanashiensis]UZX21071.1 YjfA family protein [Streptomyces tanashiensis]